MSNVLSDSEDLKTLSIQLHTQYQDYRQELFNCLSDLGCTPTSSEMDEVERIVKKGLRL